MASWNAVRLELEGRKKLPNGGVDHDGFRREKYSAVEKITGRPLIVYATDFLNKDKVAACRGDVEIDLTDRDRAHRSYPSADRQSSRRGCVQSWRASRCHRLLGPDSPR